MLKNLLKFSFAAFALTIVLFATSCEDQNAVDTDNTEVETYVENAVFEIQERSNCGKFGCYEFVFPITIEFPDETSTEVDDFEGLKTEIKAWKEANPDATDRPQLAFPLELLTEDGEVITVSSREELHDLRKECRRSMYENRGPRWHRGRGHACFKVVFPLSLTFPDGNVVEYEDKDALKTGVRTWKQENPDATERPELLFPITVELEDGSTQTVESADDLSALKDSCSAAG